MTASSQSPASTTSPTPLRAEAEVRRNIAESGGNHRLLLFVPDWRGSDPGQFVMLSPGARGSVQRTDPLLPRPMAVYRTWAQSDGAEVEILYKVHGRGTQLLSEAVEGDEIGLVGPLGRGFADPEAGQRVVLVGGGTGVASLYEFAGRCATRGHEVVVILGARSIGDLMGVDDFADLGVDLRIATEDGSRGYQGLVTELLERDLADAAPGALVGACGPTPMMRRCHEIAAKGGFETRVSLENGMACGFGVCLGCAAPLAAGGVALVCRDGPVLDGSTIAWEALP